MVALRVAELRHWRRSLKLIEVPRFDRARRGKFCSDLNRHAAQSRCSSDNERDCRVRILAHASLSARNARASWLKPHALMMKKRIAQCDPPFAVSSCRNTKTRRVVSVFAHKCVPTRQGRARLNQHASAGTAHRQPFDFQRRLTNTDRNALAFLAARPHAVVELQIVADHGDACEHIGPVADESRAF